MSNLEQFACPKCGGLAGKTLTTGRFSFNFVPTGPKPQNTGASTIDHDIDRMIGESARKNTIEYQQRQDYKLGRIHEEKLAAGDFLTRREDGSYGVMTDQERRAAKTARILHQDVMHHINQHIRSKLQ